MNLIVTKFKSLRIGWNKKPLSEKELLRLCRRMKVRLQEMPLRVPGFIMTLRGITFIAIDERLEPALKLKVAFHEVGHHILHVGKPHFYRLDTSLKDEDEAEVFALCALIPLKWVKTKTERELIEDECFSIEMVSQRKEIYEKYKL